MSKEVDITGERFGRLLILGKTDQRRGAHNASVWKAICDCGNVVFTTKTNLRDTKSCGCLKHETTVAHNMKHGECENGHSRLYKIYHNIRSRCYNASSTEYENYGGRGIKMCELWKDNPAGFFEWARSHGYSDDLTIDRIDVDGDYAPDNCRFVNIKTQANNTTRNHYITYNGETRSLSEWSDATGIPYYTLRSRINILGWDPERAFTQPVREMQKRAS